jgi:phospholipid/cholesterol/gamma-HCH transport system substrate-binding protein
MRMILRKALRYNAKAGVALILLVLGSSAVGGYILSNQRLNYPAWMPVIGQKLFKLEVELDTGQGVLPGQGQAVNVSGVRVGDIAGIELEDGKAIATLNIQERFARVYPDATALLRPKTGVKDMIMELDPGTPSAGPKLESGGRIRLDSSQIDINFADFLATMDGDTRAYLKLLVGGAGDALRDGGGRDLANTLRRFQPLSRDVAKASRLVARRRVQLRRVMSNFSKIMSELGKHDAELARFVSGSAAVFRRFANQNENLASTIELLPGALQSTNRALHRIQGLGDAMETTFADLRPTARALAPTLRQLRPFFRDTRAPIRDQLRPFTREARPIAAELVTPARELSEATPGLTRFWKLLNAIFDEMAHDPPGEGVGKESYLFYVPWAAHNTNSTLSAQDGIGPVRRGIVIMSCGSLQFLDLLERRGTLNPTLTTVVRLFNAPRLSEVCATGGGE